MVEDFGKRALSGRLHHVIEYVISFRHHRNKYTERSYSDPKSILGSRASRLRLAPPFLDKSLVMLTYCTPYSTECRALRHASQQDSMLLALCTEYIDQKILTAPWHRRLDPATHILLYTPHQPLPLPPRSVPTTNAAYLPFFPRPTPTAIYLGIPAAQVKNAPFSPGKRKYCAQWQQVKLRRSIRRRWPKFARSWRKVRRRWIYGNESIRRS